MINEFAYNPNEQESMMIISSTEGEKNPIIVLPKVHDIDSSVEPMKEEVAHALDKYSGEIAVVLESFGYTKDEEQLFSHLQDRGLSITDAALCIRLGAKALDADQDTLKAFASKELARQAANPQSQFQLRELKALDQLNTDGRVKVRFEHATEEDLEWDRIFAEQIAKVQKQMSEASKTDQKLADKLYVQMLNLKLQVKHRRETRIKEFAKDLSGKSTVIISFGAAHTNLGKDDATLGWKPQIRTNENLHGMFNEYMQNVLLDKLARGEQPTTDEIRLARAQRAKANSLIAKGMPAEKALEQAIKTYPDIETFVAERTRTRNEEP